MKKFNKYISLGVMAVSGMMLATSCDDSKDNDFVDYAPGGVGTENPYGVYFSNTENSYLELSEDSTTIVYPIYRDVAGEAVTVDVAVKATTGASMAAFTFPASVTFESGSKVADYIIGYDISKTEMGDEQQFELTLSVPSNGLASNTVVITLVNPAPWILLGENGQYYDYGWGVSADSTGPVTVSVWQQGLNPNLYRISNPYVAFNGDYNSYFTFEVLQEGSTYLGASITEPDLIGYPLYYIGYDSDNQDDVYLAFPGLFTADLSYWANNRVIQYQEDGKPGYIMLGAAYYLMNSEQAYNYPDFAPYIEIIFPDFEVLDTDMTLTYEGILTPSSQAQQVLISVELGADITNARAAVAAGKDYNALMQNIIDGKVEYTEFSESGNVYIPFGNNNETGDYTVVVVGYVGDEAKTAQYANFFYISSSSDYDPNEGWTSLGYVDYTDGFVCANIFLDEPLMTYAVELQQNNADKGIYRLVNPYGEPYPYNTPGDYNEYIDSYITFNATDPTRVYLYQDTQTLDWNYDATDEYGALQYTWSMANYFQVNGSGGEAVTDDQIAAAGYFGTYADGKITFPEPYVDEGVLYSTLAAYWSYTYSPQYDGLVYANAVLDYDTYVASNYTQPYMLNADGTLVNPFCIDMSSLSPEPARLDGHVMLTQKGLTPPRPSINKLSKVRKPMLPVEKKDQKRGKLQLKKAERRSF